MGDEQLGRHAAGAAFPQVAPDQAPESCESHADRTADRMRTAIEHGRIAVVLLGLSLSAAYLIGVSGWFRPVAVAALVAGLAYACTAWPTAERG